jgi:polyphosphate:AMP phosphotransferase
MFEIAELGSTVDKATYAREAPELRTRLLEAQRGLGRADFSTVVLVGGVEGAGKPETVNLLLEWMDARGIETHAMGDVSDEEAERPAMWRYWNKLPKKGRMGIFFGSWYTDPIIHRVFKKSGKAALDQSLDRIIEFERMLAAEGTLLIKLWLHLSKRAQKERLRSLEQDKLQRWRVSKRDWRFFKRYDEFRAVSEHALGRTSTGEAPWSIVEATDARHRNLTVTRTLLESLEGRLRQTAAPKQPKPALPTPPAVNVLRQLDLTLALDKDDYEAKHQKLQAELNQLTRQLREEHERSLILVFEGQDAAGKGGAIRRVTQAMDARDYQVISIAAPTDEERAHPYLWRFWRHLPRRGRVTVFDRSWYGRVLVERIEGFCTTDEWQRAFAEINAFEEQLTEFGHVVLKFWLQVSPEEQLRRFSERRDTPYKQYKLTEEDWRNRAKAEGYEAAACDLIGRTSTVEAPWTLVEANNKEWARLKVMKTVVKRLRAVVG